VVGFAGGCSPISPAASGGAASAQATTAPAQPKKGGRLIYGNTSGVLTTDPYPNNNPSNQFRGQLFNTLVNLDVKLLPVPELAESWTFSDDRLTLSLKLRQGVKFHSGRQFTAEDAKWNLEYTQDPRSKAQAGSELTGVRVTAIDGYTLELGLPEPLPHIFTLLLNTVIIDPQSDLARTAGGTGPFKLDGLKPGDEMRLVRHTQYWRGDRPYLDAVTIKTMPDVSSLLVALESGSVDVAFPVSSNEVKRIQVGSATSAAVFRGAGNHCYLASAVDPPLSDKRVRQAIGRSIDRKRYAVAIRFGLADPTSIVFPKASPVWDASLETGEFNLDEARQLLAVAGQPNGFDIKIQGSRGGIPELFQFNQVLQSDLAKIGVVAAIEEVEENQRVAMVAEGRFSALLGHAYGNADLDPSRLFSLFPFRPENNSSRFHAQEYSRLVHAGRTEPDWDKRIAIYRDVTRLLRDEAFILPIATPQVAYGLRRTVQGLSVTPGLPGAPYFEGVWLS
jgi:peptide/nickel transport system substrate-binding protein